jgi:Mn-dependent DtxR family transcriptional regulator
VYAWFQCKSERETKTGIRYVEYSESKFITIGEECGIDRRSASKYVQKLLDMGLLEKDDENKCYLLKQLENSTATLVPYPTLRQLVNSLNRNTVNIFVHLLNRYIASNETEFIITHKELKDRIGISSSSSSNNIVINDILDILKRLGLVTYELRQVEPSKTHMVVTSVKNVLP